MAYVSLYRKYRPQTFDDVVGQVHVTRTLANAIAEDRLHHAYLFTGPRGTGKTSTARILAKAINCEQGPTPTPCNTCRQCQEITDGSSVDVIELDMASHGGVDDARELRDRALFAPASARRKVYILDEVHMASTAAFNALLKLIEEPPEHVMFAMATTDPQKVLPTIMSRVQRLDLRRVSASDVAANVKKLCQSEGYRIEEAAIEAIVRAGDGSLRDTQSVLEQVLAYTGTEVTAEAVQQVLGQTPTEKVAELVDRIAARDIAGLLAGVQRLVDDGHDLRRFTLDLVQHVRDLLVLGAAPDHPDLVDATDERRRLLQEQASSLPQETLLRAVRVLSETVTEQRLGSPRLPLELALARLVVPSETAQLDELTDRLARLEAGAFPAPPRGAPRATEEVTEAADAEVSPSAGPEEAGAQADDGEGPSPAREAAAVAAATLEEGTSEPETDLGDLGAEEPELVSEEPPQPAEPVESEPAAPAESEPAAPVEFEPAAPVERAAGAPGDQAEVDGDQVATVPQPEQQPAEVEVAGEEPADELASISQRWEAILAAVREGSRRHHAVFAPAVPVRAGRGILTLKYGRRYASFHAANAGGGDYAAAMQAAVERVCGLRMRLEIVVEGEDDRRRPQPPSLTPEDARTPVLHGDPADDEGQPTAPADPEEQLPTGGAGAGPAERAAAASERSSSDATSEGATAPSTGREEIDEEVDVREAEASGPVEADPEQVGRLLAEELGAELVDERPAASD